MSSTRDNFAPPHVHKGDDQDDLLEISLEEIDLEALAKATDLDRVDAGSTSIKPLIARDKPGGGHDDGDDPMAA